MDEIYWLLQSVSDLPGGDDWLSENERLLLEKMKFPKRRGEWRLGRWAAKRLIASYFKISSCTQNAPSQIEVLPAENNAPQVFLRKNLLPLKISISHRGDAAFCVLQPQNHPVGCDLEIIEPRSDAFIKDYFTSKEYSIVIRASPKDQPLIANLIWSAKESVLKALEQGLKSDTRSVEIELCEIQGSESWKELSAASAEFKQDFNGWWRVWSKYVLTVFSAMPLKEPLPIQNI